MRFKWRARWVVRDTITTVTTRHPDHSFTIILSDTDELEAPCAKIEMINDHGVVEKGISAMEFPRRIWRSLPIGPFRASILFELANYFFSFEHLTEAEIAMQMEVEAAKKQYAHDQAWLQHRIKSIRYHYEVEHHLTDIELARKLKGDESVHAWAEKVGYDWEWLYQFLNFLIDEVPTRTQPTARQQPRIVALEKRILHLQLLHDGELKRAEGLRRKQADRAKTALSSYRAAVSTARAS